MKNAIKCTGLNRSNEAVSELFIRYTFQYALEEDNSN
jgi:hypothetical protein